MGPIRSENILSIYQTSTVCQALGTKFHTHYFIHFLTTTLWRRCHHLRKLREVKPFAQDHTSSMGFFWPFQSIQLLPAKVHEFGHPKNVFWEHKGELYVHSEKPIPSPKEVDFREPRGQTHLWHYTVVVSSRSAHQTRFQGPTHPHTGPETTGKLSTLRLSFHISKWR